MADYMKAWLCMADVTPKEGYTFSQLLQPQEEPFEKEPIGAISRVLVKADDIYGALEVLTTGLNNAGFEIFFVDSVQNVSSLLNNYELEEEMEDDVEELLHTDEVFIMTGGMYLYF